MSLAVRCSRERDGGLERIVLDRPKGNVLDLEMVGAIRSRLQELAATRGALKLVVFEGAGRHFSFGASVEEHLPDRIGRMLTQFHGLFRDLETLGVPTAAVVRGQCLGGGMELALWCGFVACDPSARFGVPEIKLGVFPPIAALALPWRITGSRATQLILSGDSIGGDQASRDGIADVCAADPESALQDWFTQVLEKKSAVALSAAWRASRRLIAGTFEREIEVLETLYLKDLMSRRDPVEGISAFLERRDPIWTHQ